MANDFRRLKEEANIEEVVHYLGLDVHPKGSAYFILCPLPKHGDTHATNCYYKKGWSNVYCKTCCESIQAIDLIMLETGRDYGEAADLLWEIEGYPEWYKDDSWKETNKNKVKNKNKKIPFVLSGNEAKLIGIKLPHKILNAVSCSEIPQYLSGEIPKGYAYDKGIVDEYVYSKVERVSYQDFISEQDLKELVRRRCDEKIAEYDSVEKSFMKKGVKISPFEKEREIIQGLRARAV